MKTYKSIKSFIDYMKTKTEVIGIVEYGGRSFLDESLGGDYDLTIIIERPISQAFNGVHFHIGDIPVDCMILSIEDFESDLPSNPFYLVHLDCRILFDPTNRVKQLLDEVKIKWTPEPFLSDAERHLYRFSFQHVLDKLEHRLHVDPLFTKFFIHASFDWYLQCYARIYNLPIGQPKVHINHIRAHHQNLYESVNRMYSTLDIDVQYRMLRRCAQLIMDPVGGLWKRNEVLIHLLPGGEVKLEEENQLNDLLFT